MKKEKLSRKRLDLVIILLFTCLAKTSYLSGQSIISPPTLPETHPRILILPSEIKGLKDKIQSPEFSSLWNNVQNDNSPESLALVYLLTGNDEKGKAAISGALSEISNLKASRGIKFLNPVFTGALVYDWCYPLWSEKQKQTFIDQCKRIHGSHSPYWPVKGNYGSIVSHNVEGWYWNQLIAGIAIYNENSTIYNEASNLLLEDFTEVRNFFFKSHMHHQGAYIGTRYSHVIMSSIIFNKLTNGNIFTEEEQFVPYQLIYHIRPDGQQIRTGDVITDDGAWEHKGNVLSLSASLFEDPYNRWLADQKKFPVYDKVLYDLFELILRPKKADKKPISELPLTKYFDEPVGAEMIARTGWKIGSNSSDAHVHMRIGQYYFGNHQHKDFGSFQIYYKGNLTGDSGMYQGTSSRVSSNHWKHYYRASIAHNSLLIIDPNEKYVGGNWTNTNVDGGQRWPLNSNVQPKTLQELLDPNNGYKYAEVIAYDFGPDKIKPEYSYIAGDLTDGYIYSNGLNPDKVSKVTRSMVTFNTENPSYPCVFAVFDKIISTNKTFQKKFILHSMKKPLIDSNKVVIKRGDGEDGKLVSYTLLPQKPSYKKVEGYMINNTEYDPGDKKNKSYEDMRWRIEVSPSTQQLENEFFHVMAVMDESTAALSVEKLISGELIGAKFLDRVVTFSKSGELISSAEIHFNGKSFYNILMTNLEPGHWSIHKDGELYLTDIIVKENDNTLYFKSLPGYFKFVKNASLITSR